MLMHCMDRKLALQTREHKHKKTEVRNSAIIQHVGHECSVKKRSALQPCPVLMLCDGRGSKVGEGYYWMGITKCRLRRGEVGLGWGARGDGDGDGEETGTGTGERKIRANPKGFRLPSHSICPSKFLHHTLIHPRIPLLQVLRRMDGNHDRAGWGCDGV